MEMEATHKYTQKLINAGHTNPREFWQLLNRGKWLRETIREVRTETNGNVQYHTDENIINTEFTKWWGEIFAHKPDRQGCQTEPWTCHANQINEEQNALLI